MMAGMGLRTRGTGLFAGGRRVMRGTHAWRGADCAARLHGRRTLRSMSAANRKGCEENAEDCLTAHEGECEQSRAPIVYVDLCLRQSVY
jgi:hypothetical protein